MEEVVHKSSRVSSTTTTTTTSTKTTSSSKKSGKESPEEESAKISVDMLEKSYHSSDESADDAEAARLRKISEKSETSMKESSGDNFSDDASSLLMRQTKRLFSHDYGEGNDLFQTETSTMLETSSVKTKTTSVSSSRTTVSTSESVLAESSTSIAKSASEKARLKSGELDAVTDERGLSSSSTVAKTLTTLAGSGEVPAEPSKRQSGSTSQTRSAVLEVAAVEGTTSRSITQVSENVHVTVEESKTESRSSRSMLKQTETSTVSEERPSTSLREESEFTSLTQFDSGFLESSKSDDSQMVSLTTDAAGEVQEKAAARLMAEAEVKGAAVTEGKEVCGKLSAATEVDAKSAKVSVEESHLLKAAREEEEEETESATESDTGSVGSVVGVDVELKDVQRQKLQKQESKEKDDTEEEARLAALATADSRLAQKARLPDRRADDEEIVDDKKKAGLLDRKKVGADGVEAGKTESVGSKKKTEEGEKKGDLDVAKLGDDIEDKKFDVRKKAKDEDNGKNVDGKKDVRGGEDRLDDLSKSRVDSQDTDSVDSVTRRRTREERPVDRQFRDDEVSDEATVEQTGSWIKKVEEEKDNEKAKQKELEDATSKGGDRADDIPLSEPKIVDKLKDTTVETGQTLKLRTQVTGK